MINKNPIMVEVTRGTMVESQHRVHAVVCDVLGNIVHSWGDLDLSIYPRSAIKPMQALPLLETGAADAVSVSEAEIAFACASHNGENHHVKLTNNWLERLGLDPLWAKQVWRELTAIRTLPKHRKREKAGKG